MADVRGSPASRGRKGLAGNGRPRKGRHWRSEREPKAAIRGRRALRVTVCRALTWTPWYSKRQYPGVRPTAITCASANRTDAVSVVAHTPPIDLLALVCRDAGQKRVPGSGDGDRSGGPVDAEGRRLGSGQRTREPIPAAPGGWTGRAARSLSDRLGRRRGTVVSTDF